MHRILAVSLLTAALFLTGHAALAQQQFNGRWSVKVVPERGACRRAHFYTIVVENGVPRNAVSRRTTDKVTGGLEPDGRVRASIQRHKAQVEITGKLAGRSGSGVWTVAGSMACSGRWTASKWG
jgi:hypothetical protein